MMLGLGSGRRGARSPPLFFLLLALGACLAFLALSYWVSSSRSAELQARVAALDAKVRRAAVDLSTAELQKHQLQLQLQSQLEGHKDEVGQLGLLHRQQVQAETRICNEEKEALNKNITSSTRIIQTLQEQFGELQKGYSHLSQKLQELQKKLTYDVTQCSNQINDQKELYEEQIKELNKRLAEATKFQPENRNAEPTNQSKLLQTEQKPTERQHNTELSNKELLFSRQNKDQTDQPEIEKINKVEHKTNEFEHDATSRKFAQEIANTLLDTGTLDDKNRTRLDFENLESRRIADDEYQNQKELLNTLKEKDTADYNGDEGNVAESENDKEAELANDFTGVQKTQ
ncbi:Golgi membrane protein 1 isoform X3 [Stegostoma tigrinum]|uniref:Golgi membrane protein 1 isoform X3 n=1 Tax=Stegostoma tigrinum TaxID=3053191 RepID=UPI002870AD51|nr:Golgi membrane protein 1 isoform X3 [Stegostoma tigrinum]